MTPSTYGAAAANFLRLIQTRTRSNWHTFAELKESDALALIDLLSAAGFSEVKICNKWMKGKHVDDDMRPTSQEFPVNTRWPLCVVHDTHGDYRHATYWLENVFQEAMMGIETSQPEEKTISIICKHIADSIPLEPIVLTEIGDTLKEDFTSGYPHTRDHDKLPDNGGTAGVHMYCKHRMHRMRVSNTHHVLACSGPCNLRVPVPSKVETYGDLRRYMLDGTVPIHSSSLVTAASASTQA